MGLGSSSYPSGATSAEGYKLIFYGKSHGSEQVAQAYRGDVKRLADRVEELRKEALHAHVYARSSTRLLRHQNTLLKRSLGSKASQVIAM